MRRESSAAVETSVVYSASELKDWLRANGLPAVLKTDGSSGGYGVRIVSSFEEAEAARRKLSAPPSLARAIKRALINRNHTFLVPAWKGQSAIVNAQKFIKGTEATSTALCWEGKVLAVLTFEVLRAMYPGGPSTVVRLLENQTILTTVRKTASRLGLSGICGFDFIIETGTGTAHLIELNPRATQTAHLRLGEGQDLAGSLFTAVTGKCSIEPVNEIKGDTIALFPQEWIREPESEFLRSAFQDVPWSEPNLMEAIVASERNLGNGLFRKPG
jgi:carbamoylphosphate synthase large subunit